MRITQLSRKNKIGIHAFLLGMTSVISQVLLLRELVTVFYGNETAYAIILGSWLFWVGLGSLVLSSLINKVKNVSTLLYVIQGGLGCFLPLSLLACRSLKFVFHIPTGEILGIPFMCGMAFLLLAPLTLLLGGMFVVICALGAKDAETKESSEPVSYVYLWESIGAVIGGVAFSFIIVELFSALTIALSITVMHLIVMAIFHGKKTSLGKLASGASILLIIAFASGIVGKVDQWSRQVQWKGLNVVSVTDSKYGNIALTQLKDEYSLYQNGLLSYSTKDDLSAEEIVHFPLLQCLSARNVLLIGNGFSGQLREILRYPHINVDYVEIDPKIIEVSKMYLPPEVLSPLKNPDVHLIHQDARLLVKQTSKKYDVIIVNLSDPYTALINRYYTLEFYEEAAKILNPQGILSLSVSSSENYLNKENKKFLQSIHSTLKKVFPDVRSVPGDSHIFLASKTSGLMTLDPDTLIQRLLKKRIKTKYVSKYYLPFRLSADRLRYINDVLSEKGTLNLDMHPIAYLYDIVLWSTHFNTSFKKFIEIVQRFEWAILILIPLILWVAGWARKRFSLSAPITLSIATTGFSEIVFQVIIILAFQTLYGYAYYRIGLIIASFMLGLVLGSVLARKLLNQKTDVIKKIYKGTQLSICLYPLVLPIVFVIFGEMRVAIIFSGLFATIFAALPIIAGFIGGVQYPLAVRLMNEMSPHKRGINSGGFLYGIDVLGAAVGALLAGMVLVPLWGMTTIVFLCVAVNVVVLSLLFSV